MIVYWEEQQKTERRQQLEDLKDAIEQLRDDHEPVTAENIQEQMDANRQALSENGRTSDDYSD
jgi:hypothetical protein